MMARDLNFKKLSKADLVYIAQRPWIIRDAKLEGFDIEEAAFEAQDTEHNEVSTGEMSDGTAEVNPDDAPVNPDEGDDYDEWKKEELVAETTSRGLDSTGVKADLVARLREWDTENS